MRRFTTTEEIRQARLPSSLAATLEWALTCEHELAELHGYDPDSTGSIWLVERADTDATVSEVFGSSLPDLHYERVRHDPDLRLFVAYLVRNNSRCDTLVVPEDGWLPESWVVTLLANT